MRVMLPVLGIVILLLFAVAVITSLYQPFFMVRFAQRQVPDITFYVPTDQPVFALTFDDGPNPPYTDTILNLLQQFNAKATFFVIGERIERYPQYLDSFKLKGHQVANHFYSDRPALFMSEEAFVGSLDKTESLIRQNSKRKLCRPASGWLRPGLLAAARKRDYLIVLGSAYVSDPRNPSEQYMKAALKSMLRPGVVVVLHDGGKNRERVIGVLKELLSCAEQKNLRAVTMEELLSHGR